MRRVKGIDINKIQHSAWPSIPSRQIQMTARRSTLQPSRRNKTRWHRGMGSDCESPKDYELFLVVSACKRHEIIMPTERYSTGADYVRLVETRDNNSKHRIFESLNRKIRLTLDGLLSTGIYEDAGRYLLPVTLNWCKESLDIPPSILRDRRWIII